MLHILPWVYGYFGHTTERMVVCFIRSDMVLAYCDIDDITFNDGLRQSSTVVLIVIDVEIL